jgi:hypothetical protein
MDWYSYTAVLMDWTKERTIFPEMKLRGLVPNSYIHVTVSDLYIPRSCTRDDKKVWKISEVFVKFYKTKILSIGIRRYEKILYKISSKKLYDCFLR